MMNKYIRHTSPGKLRELRKCRALRISRAFRVFGTFGVLAAFAALGTDGTDRRNRTGRALRAFTLSELLVYMLVAGIVFLMTMEGAALFDRYASAKAARIAAANAAYDGYHRLAGLCLAADSLALGDDTAYQDMSYSEMIVPEPTGNTTDVGMMHSPARGRAATTGNTMAAEVTDVGDMHGHSCIMLFTRDRLSAILSLRDSVVLARMNNTQDTLLWAVSSLKAINNGRNYRPDSIVVVIATPSASSLRMAFPITPRAGKSAIRKAINTEKQYSYEKALQPDEISQRQSKR